MIVKIIIIIIIGFILYNILKNQTEKLENENPKKRELAEKILKEISNDISYVDYLNILTNNKNTSYKLLEQETFFEIKYLFKNNKLTLEKIIEYMPDIN